MMNLEKFLAADHLLIDGDKFSHEGKVYTVGESEDTEPYVMNGYRCDNDEYIVISAACLNTKTEYVKVGDVSIFDLQNVFEDGKLFRCAGAGPNNYEVIRTERELIGCSLNGYLYRKTERPLEKWEQVLYNVDHGVDRVSLSYEDFDTLCKELSK